MTGKRPAKAGEEGVFMRKRAWLIAVAAVMALVGAACGGGGSEGGGGGGGGEKILEGGTLRVGTSGQIDSLNPFVAFNQNAYITFWYIYPFLVQYDEKLQFTADFAETWESSDDGLTWTFHTVPNAKWSDGQPLTAEDAAWSINTVLQYQSGATANSSGYVAHVKDAEATDPNTLVVHYSAPVGNVLSQWQQFAILPKHVWEKHSGNNGKDLKSYKPESELPVVSGGPFTLSDYKKDEIALFQTNPNYYGKEKPHIDGFGLRYFTNDDAMLTAFKNGELDMIDSVPETGVDAVKGNDNWILETGPSVEVNDFIINSNPKKTTHRELLDTDLKEALSHAIDKQTIVDTVFGGYGTPAATFIPPATNGDVEWSNPDLKPETFNTDLANQMLDDLGYEKGGDGIRVADGHKMAYEVITPSSLNWVNRAFQIIQADFEKIGIQLTQKSLDDSAAFEAIGAPDYEYLTFDMSIWGWVPLIDPDFMLSVFTCDQFGGWSDSGYCNPAYDELYQKQGVTIDQEERKAIVWEMEQMIYDDKPYIMLNNEEHIEVHTKDWDGFVLSPQGSLNALSKLTGIQVHRVG